MRIPILASILIAGLAACGGGDDGGTPADAPPAGADAAPQAVHEVVCTGTPPTVTTPGLNFSPNMVTIAPGGLVHFTLGATHNVVSTTPGQTFSLPLGADACLQFDTARTYSFKCGPHSFTGSVVVQQ